MAAPEDMPISRAGDKAVPTSNLSNQRTALSQYFAHRREVITNRDLITARYNDKVKFFEDHFVSYFFLTEKNHTNV